MSLTGDRLVVAMKRRGVDQEELADLVGCTQGAISKIVAGRTRNSRLMPKISAVLRFPLPWLTGVSDDDGSLGEPDDRLTDEERELLELVRGMEMEDRKAIMRLARTIATSARSPTVHDRGQAYKGAHQ